MIDQKLDHAQVLRFGRKFLHDSPDSPVLKHFASLPNEGASIPRDRFGNRMINFSKLGYFDRQGFEARASLLISREGEDFIKANKGILNDLDEGLSRLDWSFQRSSIVTDSVSFGRDRAMRYLKDSSGNYVQGGGQSDVYIFDIGPKKYLIKENNFRGKNNISQPYLNEMLQCQALSLDLEQEFSEAGIDLPKFLFASSEVACREFEEGERLTKKDMDKRNIQKVFAAVNRYIGGQQAISMPLWTNIRQDMIDQDSGEVNYRNWIKKPDGRVVCIDPVYYK